MTDQERDEFLRESRLCTLGIGRVGKGPVLAPVWYRFSESRIFEMCIGEASAQATRLRAEGRATLSVLDPGRPGPYRYVTAEGPVELVALGEDTEREILAMSTRYLGERGGLRYTEQFMERLRRDDLHDGHGDREVMVKLTPERWRTDVLG